MLPRILRSLLNVICTLLALLGALYAHQAGEKLVDAHNDIEQINDATLISNVSVNGKTVECGLFIKPPLVIQPVTPFRANSNWLQQMTISLVNRTDKTIVFGSLLFRFLDTGDCHDLPCVAKTLSCGKMPAVDAYDGRTGQPLRFDHPNQTSLDWKAGQTIVIHVSDYMDKIEERLSDSIPVTAVTKLFISRSSFYFEDGMRWNLGSYSVPDPEHRGKLKELPADYFPGIRGSNWPPGYSQ